MKASINLSNLVIPSIKLPGGAMSAAKTVDLSGLQGSSVRVYLSAAGAVEINPKQDSYWLIAEVMLPPAATQQVQNGTRIETSSTVQDVTRGSANGDSVILSANQRVGKIGHYWAIYRSGIDYTEVGGVVTWMANGRQPKAGDVYPVEILTDSTVPALEQRALPLDLQAYAVTLFDLPL